VIHDFAQLGISIVFPVGNAGPAMSDCSAAETCYINTWGAAPDAIDVAATPNRSRVILESYSSRGDPSPYHFHDETFRYEPLIAAPGTGVVAARATVAVAPYFQPPRSFVGAHGDGTVVLDRRYVGLTGTSVAAAHVAGAIALMQEAAVRASGCFLTPAQVRYILTSTATPIPGQSTANVGAGMIDVSAAVYAARSEGPIYSPDPWMCPG
jgi:subtilisin family serine protease